MDDKKKCADELLLEIKKLRAENKNLTSLLENSETGIQTSLSAISHELRNTLTLLVGSARFLEQDHPEIVSDKSWHSLWTDLLHMQTFLMDLSSFRSMKNISLSKRLCDLNFLLNEICRDCQSLFDGVHKRLIVLCPKTPTVLYADGRKLMHVFTNLIKNGMEALDDTGTVSVHVREASEKEAASIGRETIAVEVKDTGIGLSGEQLEKIFEPFYSEKSDGTGLGLPIAQTIIKAHSGQLTVASSPGKGTVFTVLLPKLLPDTDTASPSPSGKETTA
ncbi:MAG: HAMP domain-containing histidine kinase [Lachnospiraceae bacterium]|nr:HAMP domain-containing histidine kinase [Lachnospiraceae bacterium]